MLSAHSLLSECFMVLVCISPGSGDRVKKIHINYCLTTIIYEVGQGQRIRKQVINPHGVQAQCRGFLSSLY